MTETNQNPETSDHDMVTAMMNQSAAVFDMNGQAITTGEKARQTAKNTLQGFSLNFADDGDDAARADNPNIMVTTNQPGA